MTERTSYERALPGEPTPGSNSYAALPERPDEDNVSGISTPTVTGPSTEDPVANKDPILVTEQNADNATATLARSAVQEWFSTVVDALLSLTPLFFLSKPVPTCKSMKPA